MNWDQQALELWLEESARKDEDAMTLAKYSREDEGKIKELTLRLSRLTDEAADRKKKLNNEMMDTQTTQVFDSYKKDIFSPSDCISMVQ